MPQAITNHTQILMQLFYTLDATKVVYDKKARTELWKQAKAKTQIESLSSIEATSPALAHQIRKSYENGKNIQSAVFSECSYSQTLANMLQLNRFINCSEATFTFPEIATRALRENHLVPRYLYTNADASQILVQAGGNGGIDCAYISVTSQEVFTIELKEPGAKTSEPDLPKYQEDGKLLVTTQFLTKYPQFKAMLDEQQGLNFFDNIGNNIHDFSDESIEMAVSNNYINKHADVICTEDKNGLLVMLPSAHVSLWADLEGEIRPAGRNHYRVWTPLALKRFLEEKGATIVNGRVTISKQSLKPRLERGGDGKSSGHKINPLFFVYYKDCQETADEVMFNLDKVEQLNPTIAGKMSFKKLNYHQVKAYYTKNGAANRV